MELGDKIKTRRLELELTLEEIGKMVGVAKGTVHKWETGDIENMRKDKIVLLAKALKVHPLWILDVDKDSFYQTKKVPLLGTIAAGKPILADRDFSAYIDINSDAPVDFCLKVTGDSMVDARINDGDIVFVRQQPAVDDGEMSPKVFHRSHYRINHFFLIFHAMQAVSPNRCSAKGFLFGFFF